MKNSAGMSGRWKQWCCYFMAAVLTAGMFTGCSKKEEKAKETEASQKAAADVFAMDTYMTVTAYGSKSQQAVKKAEKEIKRLDSMWSTGKKNSEINRLNRKKELKVSDETISLLKTASSVWEETDGAFDITIYPLMKLWGFPTKQYQVPKDSAIREILSSGVGMGYVKIGKDGNTVKLGSKTEIDLGGIAKGYTSQKISKIFKECGVKSGVVSLGGNVQTIGKKTDGQYWKVGIQSPNESMDMVGTYQAADEAVITSGGYERYFEKNGKVYHHILDPETGRPSQKDLISVTVISKDGTLADALSTTLFIMGKEKALKFWKKNSDKINMILVDKDSKIYITQGIEGRFTSEYSFQVISQKG